MESELIEAIAKTPPHMHHAIIGYIEHGAPVGDFLSAVIENDLISAAKRADQHNQRALWEWAGVLYWSPRDAWGSKEVREAWIAKGGLSGDARSNL